MRKYLLNPGVIGAVAGGITIIKAARSGPRDWRLALLAASWGIGVALAVGAVLQQDQDVRQDEIDRELKRISKRK